jgi:hypothetical protein
VSQLFEDELRAYNAALPELLQRSSGKFALVKGDRVDSVWSTYEDAIQEGCRLYGLESFLVQQILPYEPVLRFTRELVAPCRS